MDTKQEEKAGEVDVILGGARTTTAVLYKPKCLDWHNLGESTVYTLFQFYCHVGQGESRQLYGSDQFIHEGRSTS